MRKNFRFISFVLSLVFCFSAAAFAQETTGSIEGYVKDSGGAVVPNVTVTITSTDNNENSTRTSVATGLRRTLTSSAEGFFRALQLPPGIYTLTTESTSGFGITTLNNINVSVGRVTQLDIVLTVGQGTNVVDVSTSNEAGAIDPTGSQIQTNITSRQIETIPTGVSFSGLLRLSPATRPEAKSGGFQVDGASGSENSFIIDGLDISNFKSNNLDAVNNIPTFLVQEVSVKSSGFDAEFGGATGGVVSVVTKGGSNEYRGIFGVEFDTPRFNAGPRAGLARTRNPATANGNVAEYLPFARNAGTDFFPTAQFSGPILKDKLFGLVNYSRQIFETRQTTQYFTNAPIATRTRTAVEEYQARTTYEYAFARLDANPFSQLRLSGTFLWNPQINDGIIPNTVANEANENINIGGSPPSTIFNGQTVSGSAFTSQQGGRVNSNNTTAQAIYTPTSNLVISGRFGRSFQNAKPTAYFVPVATQYICSALTGSLGTFTPAQAGCQQGFFNFPANRVTNREVSVKTNYEIDGSYILTNFVGNHQFKGGYQRSRIFTDIDSNSNITTGSINLYYGRPITDGTGPVVGLSASPTAIGYGRISRFGQTAKGSNLNQGIYIQDKWQPFRNLTLNIGVRTEKEFIPTFLEGLPTQISYGFGDKIAPRLGFAYDITGDGKTKIFASYGKFYDRLKFELPAGSFGGDFFRRDFFEIFPGETYNSFTLANVLGSFTGVSGGACPINPSGSRVRCHLDLRVPSLADPDLKPFTQREITVGVEREFMGNYLLSARYTNKEILNAVEDAGTFNQFGSEVYNIVNPCKGLHLTALAAGGIKNCVEAERKYNAFQASVERRFSRNLYFNANYTFSRLVGNYSGLASSDENGRDDPGVTRYFDIPVQGFAVATGRPDNGRLATDRPHVFNLYGSYTYNWLGTNANDTTISLFTTAQSGTPLTSTVEIFANEVILNGRGDLGRTPVFTRSDIALSHRYRFGRDNRYAMVFNINVNNVLNENNVLDVYRLTTDLGVDIAPEDIGFTSTTSAINAAISTGVGTQITKYLNSDPTLRDPRYGRPNTFQQGRNVRFGFRFQF